MWRLSLSDRFIKQLLAAVGRGSVTGEWARWVSQVLGETGSLKVFVRDLRVFKYGNL